jgi:hypothetical protein
MDTFRVPRQVTAPHGVPFSCIFYGHDPATRDYKDASKVKAVDVHPVHPWVVSADEVRTCSVREMSTARAQSIISLTS